MALPTQVTIQNPDAETNDLTGWVVEKGMCDIRSASPDPYEGNHYFWVGKDQAEGLMSQIVNFPSSVIGDIQTGNASIELTCQHAGYNNADEGRINFVIYDDYDGGGAELYRYNGEWKTTNFTWEMIQIQWLLPREARSIKIELEGRRNSGSNCDAYFDAITLWVKDLLIDNRLTRESQFVFIKPPRDDRLTLIEKRAFVSEPIRVEVKALSIEVIMTAPPIYPWPNHIPQSLNVTKY
jgi:hypothetical protein